MAETDIGLRLKLGTEQADAALKKFTATTKRSLNSIGEAGKKIFTGKWGLFGGAIAGTAIYATLKKVGEFDDKVRRLAIDSGMSTAEMLAMKNQILAVGINTGVATDELTGMSQAAYASSKNIKFVKDEMGFMAKVAQASGASGEEVGEMLGMLQRETELTGEGFEDLIKRLGAFGATKGAHMNLKQFLPQAGDLLRTAKLLARTGDIKDVGKVLMEGEFTGAPRQVAQAYLTMHGKANLKLIQRLGLKQGFTLVDAIQSVFKKIPKDKQTAAFEMLLGRRGIKGLAPLIENVNQLAEAEREASGIDFLGRANEQSKSFGAALNKLNSAFMTVADSAFAPVIDEITKSLKDFNPDDIKAIAEAMGGFSKVLISVAKGAGLLVNALTELPTLLAGTKEAAAGEEMKRARSADISKFIASGTKAKAAGETEVARRYYIRAMQLAESEGDEALRQRMQSILVQLELNPDAKKLLNQPKPVKAGAQGLPK